MDLAFNSTKYFDNTFQKSLLRHLSKTNANKPHTRQIFQTWHDLPAEHFNNFPLKIDKDGTVYTFLANPQKISPTGKSFVELTDMLNNDVKSDDKSDHLLFPYFLRMILDNFAEKNQTDYKEFLPEFHKQTENIPLMVLPHPFERKLIVVKNV